MCVILISDEKNGYGRKKKNNIACSIPPRAGFVRTKTYGCKYAVQYLSFSRWVRTVFFSFKLHSRKQYNNTIQAFFLYFLTR